MKNLLTDVPGLKVGNARTRGSRRERTAVVFDAPAAAGVAVPGGSPALRDTGLLKPEMTVARVDAFVLSGGSVFGLDAAGGVDRLAACSGPRPRGRRGAGADRPRRGACSTSTTAATRTGAAARPISISAGRRRKAPGWTSRSAASAPAAARRPAISRAGSARRARFPRAASSSARSSRSTRRASATRGASPRFWAAAYERGAEFGGLGEGAPPTTRSSSR